MIFEKCRELFYWRKMAYIVYLTRTQRAASFSGDCPLVWDMIYLAAELRVSSLAVRASIREFISASCALRATFSCSIALFLASFCAKCSVSALFSSLTAHTNPLSSEMNNRPNSRVKDSKREQPTALRQLAVCIKET